MSKTILIVEDETIVAEDLAGRLKDLGYQIAGVVATGEAAVARVDRQQPDLVLMDIRLEGPMDGVAAARAIQERHDVPVIYLTAHSDPATLSRAKLTGPFGYILKPFEERSLATQIELAHYKHQADRQINEQREWLRVTLTSIGDAVIATDADGHVTFVNPTAESLIGCAADETIGQPVLAVFQIVNDQTGQAAENPVARVLRDKHTVSLANHTTLVTRDGRTVPIEDSAAPIFDAAGQLIGAVLVFRDVTQRRKAQQALCASRARYKELLAVLPAAMVTCDAEGVLTYYNDQAAQIWGHTPAIGDTDQRFCGSYRLYREDGTPLAHEQTPMATVLRHATRIRGQEIIIERPDGSRTWVSVNIDPLFDEQGHPCGAISVFTDISGRKQAEALLEQSEKRLRILNENLEREVADRTEIANLRTKQLQTLTVELIEAEEAERNRIAQLLHDDLQQMLASANLQLQTATHPSPADPILVNVGETLERSISKARRLSHELSPPVLKHTSLNAGFGWLSRMMEEQFNLKVELDTVAAPSVEYDALKTFIFRAAQELLFNVVKHADVQTARLVLSQIDKSLVLSVSDQGRGFDAGCLDNRSFKKTGLGLRSLRERASYMGGSLEIEQGPDQGSRVTLTIPVNGVGLNQPRRRMTDRKTNRPSESPGQTDMGPLRVLFVDDHPMMREGLIKMVATIPTIEVAGEASNGREAIDQVGYLKPDVVVMDVSMPKMNGIEATYQIKQKYPDVRVIGLSMFNEEEISLQMQQAGAETLVCKSASSAELLKAIYGARQENQRIVEEQAP